MATKFNLKDVIFDVKDLPTTLPLMAIEGGVLLPRAQLPVPIQDLDHLMMIIEALKTNKMVGLVQPLPLKDSNNDKDCHSIFKTGCVGKILDLSEIEEGKFLVTLKGICRFKIVEEITVKTSYRQAKVAYEEFAVDCVEDNDFAFDRSRLLKALEQYFKLFDIVPNWQEIAKTSNEKLITALTMVCPLEAREKQALLEAPTPREQSQLITTIIELATFQSISPTCH